MTLYRRGSRKRLIGKIILAVCLIGAILAANFYFGLHDFLILPSIFFGLWLIWVVKDLVGKARSLQRIF